jgi:hypothetical protein
MERKMTQSKMTPGNWHRNIKPASKYPTIFAGRNTHVATVNTTGMSEEEIEANISAIAALPDLIEALQGMIKYSTFNEGWQDENPEYVEKARAALTKAGVA